MPTNWIVALGALAAGVILCFAGYRMVRFALGLVGFAAGLVTAGWFAFWHLHFEQVWSLLIGLAGGVVGALLLSALYYLGVFVLGATVAVGLGYYLPFLSRFDSVFPVLICGIVGGVIALVVQRTAITVATAALGAWWAAVGLGTFMGIVAPPSLFEAPFAIWTHLGDYPFLAIIAAVLFLLGLTVQFKSAARPAKAARKAEKTKD